MKRKLALLTAAAVISANAFAFDFGVNIHTGGGNTTADAQIASLMANRNLKQARMDLFASSDYSMLRDQVIKINANGGKAQLVALNSYQWANSCSTNLAAVEQDAYNQTYSMVGAVKDVAHIFEALNEVQLWPQVRNEVPFNSAGTSTAPYAGKPCVAAATAAVRGTTRAIHDQGQTAIVGVVGRDFGWLTWLAQNGVTWDATGYHIYPHYGDADLRSDPWFGAGGPLAQLASFGKPVTINEFNCGEIYDSNYENTAGQPVTEQCLRSVNKHMGELVNQTIAQLYSVHLYELLDEPTKAAPENRFGLRYDLNTPKVVEYLVAAWAGGNLTSAEQSQVTSRGLLTDTQIAAMKATAPTAAPAPAPAPAPTTTQSAQGASITTSGTLVDSTGATWTVSGGVIYRNGTATVSSNVTLLLYWNQVIYQQNALGDWWCWVNGGWQATTDPRVASASDTQLPVVSISNPTNGSVYRRGSTISVSAAASDNVAVKQVTFLLNGSTRCVSNSAPYQCQVVLPNQRHWTGTLQVQAVDPSGNVGSKSIQVSTY